MTQPNDSRVPWQWNQDLAYLNQQPFQGPAHQHDAWQLNQQPFQGSANAPLAVPFNQPQPQFPANPPLAVPFNQPHVQFSGYQHFDGQFNLLPNLHQFRAPLGLAQQQPNRASLTATWPPNQPPVRFNQPGIQPPNQQQPPVQFKQPVAQPPNQPGVQPQNQPQYPVLEPIHPLMAELNVEELSYSELQQLSDAYREVLNVDQHLPSAEPRGLRELIRMIELANESAQFQASQAIWTEAGPSTDQPQSSNPDNPTVAQPFDQLRNRIDLLFVQLTYQLLLELNGVDQQRLNVEQFRRLLFALANERRNQQSSITAPPLTKITPSLESIGSVHLAAWLGEVEKVLPASSQSIREMISQLENSTQLARQPPAAEVIEIDPSKDSASSDQVRPTDQSIGTNSRDLVLVHQDLAAFNNRWKPTELVDNQVVRFWATGPVVLDRLNLRRIKIYGFPGAPLHNLLQFLGTRTKLLELEIDILKLLHDRLDVVYEFKHLRILSIDSIRIFDGDGRRVEREPKALAKFNAPNLNALFLGEQIDQLNTIFPSDQLNISLIRLN